MKTKNLVVNDQQCFAPTSCVQLAPSPANWSQNSNVENFLPDLHNISTTYVVKKHCRRHEKRLKIIRDFPIIDAASTLVLQQQQFDIFEVWF